MGLIQRLPNVITRATEIAEAVKKGPAVPFVRREIIRGKGGEGGACPNMLALGDNLDFIGWLLTEKQMAGKVQL
ncbi:MAG: hypothetical protein IKX91_01980, partial [Firmicutes bacterium]|nr:hypothetical protein [Bacillota bacterium]